MLRKIHIFRGILAAVSLLASDVVAQSGYWGGDCSGFVFQIWTDVAVNNVYAQEIFTLVDGTCTVVRPATTSNRYAGPSIRGAHSAAIYDALNRLASVGFISVDLKLHRTGGWQVIGKRQYTPQINRRQGWSNAYSGSMKNRTTKSAKTKSNGSANVEVQGQVQLVTGGTCGSFGTEIWLRNSASRIAIVTVKTELYTSPTKSHRPSFEKYTLYPGEDVYVGCSRSGGHWEEEAEYKYVVTGVVYQ